MKKLFALLLTFAAVALFAADYQFPGWKCTDQAKLTAAAAAAPNAWAKAQIAVLQKLAAKQPADFAEFCAVIDEVVKGSEIESKEYAFVYFKKQFAYCRGEFMSEAWEFCVKNPTEYDLFYLLNKSKVQLSDVTRYSSIRDYLLKYRYDVATTNCALDMLIDLAASVDGTDSISVKTDLQKMNRKFSKNLLDDKAAWEPVIAKIRTTLETY